MPSIKPPSSDAPPRSGFDALTSILDKATKARSKGIQLKGMDIASELSQQMIRHADSLEKLYGQLKTAVSEDPVKEEMIADLVKEFEQMKLRHEKAEVWLLMTKCVTTPNCDT